MKKSPVANVSYWEVEELAAQICGVSEEFEEDQIDSSELEEKLYEEFEIDMEQFHKIVSHLVPLADCSKSPLTEKLVMGFSNPEHNMWICRTEASLIESREEN
jgi:hypothetical protein